MEIVPKPRVVETPLMSTAMIDIAQSGQVSGIIYVALPQTGQAVGHVELNAGNLEGARALHQALGAWIQNQSPIVIANGKV
jgi:hypothetical protein